MDDIENARHDLSEATCSVETAIELLSSMKQDRVAHEEELEQIIDNLVRLKYGLEDTYRRLLPLSPEAKGP